MTLEKLKRPLNIDDIEKGAEFTLAQITSVRKIDGSNFTLHVGDVIEIERRDSEGFNISINGHFKKRDSPRIPFADVGDFTIETE